MSADALKKEIAENHHQFEVPQLLEIIRENFPDAKLYFETDAALAFPSSDISAVNMSDNKRMTIRLPMANLLGVTTPLPIGLSDYVSRGYKNAEPLTGFMSIMQNRIHHLFTKALVKYNIWRGGGEAAARIFEKMSARTLERFQTYDLFWLSPFSRRTRSTAGLKHIVNSIWKGIPIRVSENIGRWTTVENRRALGGGARLGRCSVAGSKVYDRTAKFRVTLGPVDIDTYKSMLPGASGFALFENIISLYINEPLICELEILCFIRDLESARLGDAKPGGGLGMTLLLGRVEDTDDSVHGYRQIVR